MIVYNIAERDAFIQELKNLDIKVQEIEHRLRTQKERKDPPATHIPPRSPHGKN